MKSDEDDIGDAFALAELLEKERTRNDDATAENEHRLGEYNALREKLSQMVSRPTYPLWAPVAGGLAFFEAEIENTNRYTVLLGDNWFVERSAAQAQSIAARRLEFLTREQKVLKREAETIDAQLSACTSQFETQTPDPRVPPDERAIGEAGDHDGEGEGEEGLTLEEILELEAELDQADEPLSDAKIEAAIRQKVTAKKKALGATASQQVHQPNSSSQPGEPLYRDPGHLARTLDELAQGSRAAVEAADSLPLRVKPPTPEVLVPRAITRDLVCSENVTERTPHTDPPAALRAAAGPKGRTSRFRQQHDQPTEGAQSES